MSADFDTEICVIGGGAAGASVALRLAQLGRRVCVLERARFPRSHVGESLPSSIWPILRLLGLDQRVVQAGFLRSTGSILHWGGRYERLAPNPDQPTLLVDRARFDSLVLSAAGDAGVHVLDRARAYRPYRTSSGWNIPVRSDRGQFRVTARMMIDAAGRQAGLGRRYCDVSEPLMALYAYWQAPPGFGTQTRVEAGDRQWYWGALLPDGTVNAMVFVDPSLCVGLGPTDRRDLYLNLLAQSTLLAPCLEQRRIGPVRRSDATSRIETTPPGSDLLRVGEASLSVDPLSSQGVQMAMAQAVQAAVVANTVLMRSQDTDLALRFFAVRQAERSQTHAALAAEHYRMQQAVAPDPFWSSRARGPDQLEHKSQTSVAENVPTGFRLVLCPQTRLVKAGVQGQAFIEAGEVASHPNLPRPVANLDGVPIVPLLRNLRAPADTSQIAALWAEKVSAEKAARILRWLWQNKMLVVAD